MTQGPIARLTRDLSEASAAKRAETYATINVRPGEKVSAMLELLAELRRAPVATLVTEALSARLADYAVSDPSQAKAILDAVEACLAQDRHPSPGSALGILHEKGSLKIEHPAIKMPEIRFEK